MNTEEKIDQMLQMLTGFISKQETFNAKQEVFNAKQEAFNAKQEDFNENQLAFNQIMMEFKSNTEKRFDTFEEMMQEKFADIDMQNKVTHRLLMQAFEHITDLKI